MAVHASVPMMRWHSSFGTDGTRTVVICVCTLVTKAIHYVLFVVQESLWVASNILGGSAAGRDFLLSYSSTGIL
jgi:hypothetical protein